MQALQIFCRCRPLACLMKILNLYFKNINSLEGENRVNFEQPPFTDTGVFAITGPNGSGKSSILDAITLGLYGETFRFDRPAGFVMTQRTAECFAIIEFALANEKYRSSWRVQREGGQAEGELLPAEMQLVRLGDGTMLASGVDNVCKQILAVTGMDFHNFTRAILLAQGNFAAFLNALDSERMAILETILGTDIYADYKNEAFAKASQAQQGIDALNQQLQDIPLLPDVQLEANGHDLADFEEQVLTLREAKKLLQHQQQAQFRVSGLTEQLHWQNQDLAETETQLQANAMALAQIDSQQAAADFAAVLHDVAQGDQGIQQSRAALAALNDELQQLKLRLGNAPIAEADRSRPFAEQLQNISAIKAQVNLLAANQQSETSLWQSLGIQINEKKAVLAELDAWLQEQAKDAVLLEQFPDTAQLKKLRQDLAEASQQQALLAKSSKQTYSSLQSSTTTLDKKSQLGKQLQQQLQQAEQHLQDLADGKTIADIESLAEEQQQRVKDFTVLNKLAEAYDKLAGNSGFLGLFAGKAPEVLLDPVALAGDLAVLREAFKREQNIALTLENAVLREGLFKKMHDDRQHLAYNTPCPLCGALQHPYAQKLPVMADSVQALADQHIKVKALTAKIDSTEKSIVVAQKQHDKYQAKQVRIQQLQAEWTLLCNRLNAADQQLGIGSLAKIKGLLQTETDDLKNISALLNNHRRQQATIDKLKAQLAKNTGLVEQLQADLQTLDAAWQSCSAEQEANNALVLKLQQEEQALTATVAGQLALLGETMPATGQEDALFDRLSQRRQAYLEYTARRTLFGDDLAILMAKQAACQTEIDQYNQQLGIYSNKLQAEELIGLHLAVTEKQKLIADQAQDLAQQQLAAEVIRQALQNRLQGSPFASAEALQAALQLLATRPQVQKKQTELEALLAQKTAERDSLSQQLQQELAEAAQMPTAEVLAEQLKRNAEQLSIAQMELQRLQKLLQEQQQWQQQQHRLLAELQQQQERARPHLEEAERIRSESGMVLRRRVQNQVAERLLVSTNTMLEKISGRYYLRQAASEQGLALEVEDTLQGNVRRLPKTLSGGESFVVSLALALGLSELASNGKSVDSLFLDEGFGNLDSEALFTVITTLERLHTHGKMVGVISHVDVVKKRFKAQLQMVKKPNGMGALKKAS